MDFFSKRIIKGLLKKHRVFPKKRFGQNFLIDKRVLRKIITAANLKEKDVILEIGAGIGNLTQELAKKAKPARQSAGASRRLAGGKVIAIEKDEKMVEILKETVGDFKNVKIIQADILKVKNGSMAKWLNGSKYKVVANLPYYIVSPVIHKFLESKNPPKEMILMAQKEVAQRVCAKPPDMNLLAVSVQFYSRPEIISFVPKKSFWPQPKVDSAILRITQIHTDTKTDPHRFFQIVKAGFSQPRKQLINNLHSKLSLNRGEIKQWLKSCGINPSLRAEALDIKAWKSLAKNYRSS